MAKPKRLYACPKMELSHRRTVGLRGMPILNGHGLTVGDVAAKRVVLANGTLATVVRIHIDGSGRIDALQRGIEVTFATYDIASGAVVVIPDTRAGDAIVRRIRAK